MDSCGEKHIDSDRGMLPVLLCGLHGDLRLAGIDRMRTTRNLSQEQAHPVEGWVMAGCNLELLGFRFNRLMIA